MESGRQVLRQAGSEDAHVADRLIVRGAREHNLRRTSTLDLPRDTPDRLHRAVRLGQVQPGLRHDLRRGPAPLRRVAVGLRPPVPRPDGQARRRLHRGPVAGGLDRPEVDQPQPALDRRHDHRGLRLPAPALRPHRRAALPGVRRADRAADAAADRRPGARARAEGTRFQVLAPVVRGRKGEYVDLFARAAGPGLLAGRGSTATVARARPSRRR